eukprot:TRINITY_DN6505_c0_g1_i3.p1 TRINITY_DN6505_c0_g1~~TRINITY_DN6505_c0_g1_i3.p1  ORF type:complete len:369 (+),score=112.59 TRINITY_DN6505_c0_g1_i3:70-1176(+)
MSGIENISSPPEETGVDELLPVDPVIDQRDEPVNQTSPEIELDSEDSRLPVVKEEKKDDKESTYSSPHQEEFSQHRTWKDVEEIEVMDDAAAEAAKYATLVKKNHLLEEQIEKLEDTLFEAEEEVMTLQRSLLLNEEEITDTQAILQHLETQNDDNRRELSDRHNRLDEETTRFNELDAEKRKFDGIITVLEARVLQSYHVNQKIEVALSEMEALRKHVAELMERNGELGLTTERQARELVDIEKKFTNESTRHHHIHAKAVAEFEKLVLAERKRSQEALDYVRATLKARIQGLELQLTELETGTESRRLKRKMERELMQANRKYDTFKEQRTRNALQIESLEKQADLEAVVSTQSTGYIRDPHYRAT